MRLVNNIDELDQEILDCTLSYESRENNLQEKILESKDALQLIRKRWPPTRSLFPPKSIQAGVNWTPLTSEFLSCSSIADWSRYKRYCKHRNRWGQFVRSNLDWDWDLASSLKRLYRLPRTKQTEKISNLRLDVPTPSLTVDQIDPGVILVYIEKSEDGKEGHRDTGT